MKIKINILDFLKLSALALLGFVFLYLLFNWIMSAVIHSRKEVMVPDLKGKSISDAVYMVSEYNLGLKKEREEFDQGLPAGTVLRQNPLPGTTVREGKIVRVTISQGGEVIFTPNLINQPVRSAEIVLRSSGLTLGEELTRYSIIFDQGTVISQDPESGSIIEKDSHINLVVSAGPPPKGIKLMPDLTGKSIDDARSWAENFSLALEIKQDSSEGFQFGTITSQEPIADSDITESEYVTVYVSVSDSFDKEDVENFPGKKFYYEITQGAGNREIKLTLIDESGEKEIFKGARPPGSKLVVPISPKGMARVRIFINNILVEEREVEN